jgi:hypothetical protein
MEVPLGGPGDSRTADAWCEPKAKEALAKWEQRGAKALAVSDRWYNGHIVSFTVQYSRPRAFA